MDTSRRRFIKYGVAGAVGFGVASAIEIPLLNNSIQNDNKKISDLQSQNSSLQTQLAAAQSKYNESQGFLTLNPTEQAQVEAIAEAMIPTDSNGPGAKEAGVIYFIDRMLAGNYGKAGNYFMQGPFVYPTTSSVTVEGTDYATGKKQSYTYSNGTIKPRLQAGTAYQYSFNPRQFWRSGLQFLDSYCKSAFGGSFQSLTATQQTTVLQNLFSNDATALTFFTGPTPAEFFNELHDMVTAGYWTDPLYGGNIGMVGWNLLAFPGLNQGTSAGYTSIQLATASTPTRLTPLSLGDLQRGATM